MDLEASHCSPVPVLRKEVNSDVVFLYHQRIPVKLAQFTLVSRISLQHVHLLTLSPRFQNPIPDSQIPSVFRRWRILALFQTNISLLPNCHLASRGESTHAHAILIYPIEKPMKKDDQCHLGGWRPPPARYSPALL